MNVQAIAQKFSNPDWTAKGEARAHVDFRGLETLWVNTGTLCNITCQNCYIESSPENDRLVYLTPGEMRAALDEARARNEPLTAVGFTGGEPFLNPYMAAMIEETLNRGLSALVLTNAMKPMLRPHVQAALVALKPPSEKLTFRVSIDHWRKELHDEERGLGAFDSAMQGLTWLSQQRFNLAVAGRLRWGDRDADMRAQYAELFARENLRIDAFDHNALVLFPEMDERADVPEITTACWGILHKNPGSLMCANTRMLIKRKGADHPAYVSCTLLPYDPQFEMGATLSEASRPIKLNHPHCAKFCVLGGASCS
jgi:sulfatase maturation enzyme AslB (radical SAM superfamily)